LWLIALALLLPEGAMASLGPSGPSSSPEDGAVTGEVAVAKAKPGKTKKKRKGKVAAEEPAAEPTAEATAEPAAAQPAPEPPPPAPVPAPVRPPVESTAVEAAAPLTATDASSATVAPEATAAPAPSPALEAIRAAPLGAAPEVGTSARPEEKTAAKPVFPLTVGVELGVGFPQLVSPLRTTFVPTLEIGYLLPVLAQRLQVTANFTYVMPDHSNVEVDPRFAGSGSFRYKIKEEEVLIGLGTLYRFFPPRTFLNFYAQGELEVHLQRSTVRGQSGGEALGINQETETAVGGVVGGGAELLLGPGALAAELLFGFSDLDHRVTGESTAGGLRLQIGYHLLF
jgi:hypothetical protein